MNFNTLDKHFAEIIEKCASNCSVCKVNIDCGKIKKEIIDWDTFYSRRVSMSILANRKDIWKHLMDDIKKNKVELEQGVETIIKFLTGTNPNFQSELDAKRERLEKSYFGVVKSLSKLMIDFSFEIHEELIYGIKPMRRIPFRVHFQNTEIQKILIKAEHYLETNKEKKNINAVRSISKQILKLTEKISIGTERHLLLAILNYNFNQLDYVNLILSDYVKDETLLYKEEYILIQLLAMHQNAINRKNIYLYKEAKDLCRKSMKKYPDDSRFSYMFGAIIGRGIDSSLEQEESITTSLEYFRRALKLTDSKKSDPRYEAAIWNSIAYAIYISKEKTKEQIHEAFDAISNMSALVKEEDWDANFFDTKGLVYCNLDSDITDSVEEHLSISKNCFSKAIELAEANKYLSYEKKEIAKHLEMLKKKQTNVGFDNE